MAIDSTTTSQRTCFTSAKVTRSSILSIRALLRMNAIPAFHVQLSRYLTNQLTFARRTPLTMVSIRIAGTSVMATPPSIQRLTHASLSSMETQASMIGAP